MLVLVLTVAVAFLPTNDPTNDDANDGHEDREDKAFLLSACQPVQMSVSRGRTSKSPGVER
jgi:hypothetical protein